MHFFIYTFMFFSSGVASFEHFDFDLFHFSSNKLGEKKVKILEDENTVENFEKKSEFSKNEKMKVFHEFNQGMKRLKKIIENELQIQHKPNKQDNLPENIRNYYQDYSNDDFENIEENKNEAKVLLKGCKEKIEDFSKCSEAIIVNGKSIVKGMNAKKRKGIILHPIANEKENDPQNQMMDILLPKKAVIRTIRTTNH